MITRLLLPGIGLSIAGLLPSCSVLIDVNDQQCNKDQDCLARGAAFAGSVCEQHLCVKPSDTSGGEAGGSSVADPLVCSPIDLSSEATVKYSFAPVFAPGAEPTDPKPFSIKACGQLDISCEHPVFGPIDVNAGEPQDFLVKPGFAGFFEIKNPDTLDGLLFLGRPVNADTVGWNVTMPTPEVVTGLALATGEDISLNLGFILSVARDCNGQLLDHVAFNSSKGGLGYYFVMNLPDTSLTQTGPQGAAGYANVPISTTILTGQHESGKMLGPVSVRVKPNTLSLAEIWP